LTQAVAVNTVLRYRAPVIKPIGLGFLKKKQVFLNHGLQRVVVVCEILVSMTYLLSSAAVKISDNRP